MQQDEAVLFHLHGYEAGRNASSRHRPWKIRSFGRETLYFDPPDEPFIWFWICLSACSLICLSYLSPIPSLSVTASTPCDVYLLVLDVPLLVLVLPELLEPPRGKGDGISTARD